VLQAEAIALHIPYVIGMNQAVGDAAAREFAVGFYDALGAGRTIEFAYKFACNSMRMAGIEEHLTPVLLTKKDTSVNKQNFLLLAGKSDLDLPFYINRPPHEEKCFKEISEPGALIRIKAPRQMGKSFLMLRIVNRSIQQGYRATRLDLRAAGKNTLGNLDNLLKWLCSRISHNLGLSNRVEECWQGISISNDKCTNYFEKWLLKEPLVLGLDNVDELFQYTAVAEDFLKLLRAWFEESRSNPVWQNLRLVIAHSKEQIPLNINHSPFNVGLPLGLSPFNDNQAKDLIKHYGLRLLQTEEAELMNLTGGHPYLLRVALDHLVRKEITITEMVEIAHTAQWAYCEHLLHHLTGLQNQPELMIAMQRIIVADRPVRIKAVEAAKLSSMGLVRYQGNDVVIFCGLYRKYFWEMLEYN
jgi:AAA-like domain